MNKITEVFLIRHSEQLKLKNEDLIDEDSQIRNEKMMLSVYGEKMAEKISKLPELEKIDKLWSSNYVRAISTAKYIADNNNLEINIDLSIILKETSKILSDTLLVGKFIQGIPLVGTIGGPVNYIIIKKNRKVFRNKI